MLGKLSFGVLRNKSREKVFNLTCLPNFRKYVLFDYLPYLAHLDNPAILDVMKNGIVDDLILQQYLLVTWLLKDSI